MVSSEHPLVGVLAGVARGEFPRDDGTVEFLPAPATVSAALVVFAAHLFVCGIERDVFEAVVNPGDFSAWTGPRLCHAVETTSGGVAGNLDAMLVATGRGIGVPPDLVEVADSTHPRAMRARRYRPDVRVFAPRNGAGVLIVGRGLVNRWEVAYEVARSERGTGLARMLASAALDLLPRDEAVWAQVAPANAPSLRVALAAGWSPVGAELLFANAPDRDESFPSRPGPSGPPAR